MLNYVKLTPNDLSVEDINAIVELVNAGGKVVVTADKIQSCVYVAVAFDGEEIVAVGAIKTPLEVYVDGVGEQANATDEVNSDNFKYALGYFARKAGYKDSEVVDELVSLLVDGWSEPLFVTTSSTVYQEVFSRYGFVAVGDEWEGTYTHPLKVMVR